MQSILAILSAATVTGLMLGCATPDASRLRTEEIYKIAQVRTQARAMSVPPEVVNIARSVQMKDGLLVGDETIVEIEHALRFKSLTLNQARTLRLKIKKPANYQRGLMPYVVVLAVEELFIEVPQDTNRAPRLILLPSVPAAPSVAMLSPSGSDGGYDSGADGGPGTDGGVGPDGSSGESIDFYLLFQKITTNNPASSTGPFLRILARGEDGQQGGDGSTGGNGGNGGRGTPSECEMAPVVNACVACKAGPGQGGWGARGGRGGNGGSGGSGGSGPTIYIAGPDLSVAGFFELQAPGGTGARGGRGGTGGPGGAAGGGGYQCKCCAQGGPSGLSGEAGIAGTAGNSGAAGSNGSEVRGARKNQDVFQ